MYFYEAFKRGYLCQHQSKILYVFLDYFPEGYVENGWKADE